MKFSHVADYLSRIEQTTKRTEITILLAELLQQSHAQEAYIICTLALGMLHPPYKGVQFTIAQKMISHVVARLLNESIDTVQKKVKQYGDIGLVVEQGVWSHHSSMRLVHVYEALSDIALLSGSGSQEKKIHALYLLLHQLDPLSAKYITRVVLGRLRLGFSDMTIIDALSWMYAGNKSLRAIIEHAYNICVDIGFIAYTLKEQGIHALEQMQIRLGIPIRPAAAERLPNAQAVIEKLGTCVAQPKLDGFRVQLHLDKRSGQPSIHFFSRNMLDMSAMFPDLTNAAMNIPADTLIAEGEAIVYNPNTGDFLPFQETVKRKRKHDIEQMMQELPLQLFLFDLLYLNGRSCLQDTHAQRRAILLTLLPKDGAHTIRIIDEARVHTAQELSHYFLRQIETGLEGLVIKREDALYTPGKRNFNWIKLKRQEEGQLEDTLDAVIVGYYAGQGKRADFGIGAFLVSIYNKPEDRFETIAKIGTGLKDADWKELKQRCDTIAVPTQPKQVWCAKELVPDVWVQPEMICIVRADEITLSPLHTAGKKVDKLGYALRFPRFMGYRTDKSLYDITEIHEVERLYQDQYR